ncbi:polysaccharide pyruvyl transferase family protein [Patescibacteria group bacterium]|nr:polysaccharide pyruvyl transferase family protein [Patescibacteria group bacterium]MBU1123028.1 polysaccharide pyruvyl transferase family protein [Patescibacteria group bacterium]MBU1911060.1 polysaccharide pyruvyl transferase family protein [Patescibacteria group bacterium]
MSYLLIGNYGVGNLGDEALKDYFLMQYPQASFKVISANPVEGEVPRLPCGFRSIFKPWWKTLNALRKSRGMVFGGGSLFTDIESPRACLIWWWHAFVARLFGKKIYLTFQGIGPFKTGVGEWCARWVVKRSVFISVRDNLSFDRIKDWKKNTNVVQTCDPIISLINNENPESCSQNILIVIPRNNSSESFLEALMDIKQRGRDQIRFLSLNPASGKELELCTRMSMSLGMETEIIPIKTLGELIAEISKGKTVLTQRYHGALVAIALGKEVQIVMQGEGDKLSALKNIDRSKILELYTRGEEALTVNLSAS